MFATKMTPELEQLLDTIEQDIQTGKNMSPAFSDSKSMDEYLDAL
jgi:hypothetical protein